MHLTKRILVGLLSLSLALAACCAPQKPPKHDCPVETLVVDEAVFPPGTNAGSLESPLPEAAWASAGCTFYLPRGVAGHSVYQHKTPRIAAEEFLAEKRARFVEDRNRGPWSTPGELTYRSPIADQYYVACGLQWGNEMCKMIARYEEYYIIVTSHMSEDGMTYADFQRVLRAVDEKMSACLGKPLTPEAASP